MIANQLNRHATPQPGIPRQAIAWWNQHTLVLLRDVLIRCLPITLFLVLGARVIAAESAPGAATPLSIPPPMLTDAWPNAEGPGTVTILGVDFTPGGRVEVLVSDPASGDLIQAHWVTATSPDLYAPIDRFPQTVSYARSGVITITVPTRCGSPIRIRAYDQLSSRWSNYLTYDPAC